MIQFVSIFLDFIVLPFILSGLLSITDEDEEDDYQLLRRAVKEYRGTMKEYYKAVGCLFLIFPLELAFYLL